MRPRNRHELEVMGCVALFVLVTLTLVGWTLYEHGYLGTALAVVGVIVVSVGVIYAYRGRVVRGFRVNRRRHQHQGQERQGQLRREQEPYSAHSDPPARSVPQESRKEEERSRGQFERDTIVQRLSEISEGEFEQLMVFYFRRRGYTVEPAPASGERGADLLITASDRHIAVRLKRQDVPVGNRAVQEVLSGRAFYGAYEAWVITNNTFTRAAYDEARVAGVRLIDGNELVEWLNDLLDLFEDEPR